MSTDILQVPNSYRKCLAERHNIYCTYVGGDFSKSRLLRLLFQENVGFATCKGGFANWSVVRGCVLVIEVTPL